MRSAQTDRAEQRVDGKGEVRQRGRHQVGTPLARLAPPIAVRHRVGEDLDPVPDQVDEPDLADPGSRVERELDQAVIGERRVGDLDEEQDVAGRGSRSLRRVTRAPSVGCRPPGFSVTQGPADRLSSTSAGRQDLAAVVDGLEAAWTPFGGVIRRLVVDNLKPVVTRADRYTPTLDRVFLEYAQYRRFVVGPAVPRHATGPQMPDLRDHDLDECWREGPRQLDVRTQIGYECTRNEYYTDRRPGTRKHSVWANAPAGVVVAARTPGRGLLPAPDRAPDGGGTGGRTARTRGLDPCGRVAADGPGAAGILPGQSQIADLPRAAGAPPQDRGSRRRPPRGTGSPARADSRRVCVRVGCTG